ncbi:MAG: 16S rRNA (uracil(1498)-N(3))-methyltransferase [Deltaproteobacteria bacterium]|nr:16S rRNA (uracil(1498)-N(3))-methyltransferase [Deltaproteobacteria bacterium]
MHTPRFVIRSGDRQFEVGELIELVDDDLHHLRDVFRAKPGAEVEIVVADRKERFRGTVAAIEKRRAEVRLEEKLPSSRVAPLTLILGMPKGPASELIVEKCTEIGVENIVLFAAERTQNPSQALSDKRIERLYRVADAALKQCGGTTIPHVSYAQTLEDALRNSIAPKSLRSVLVSPQERTAAQVTGNAHQIDASSELSSRLEKADENADFLIVVGPEGGLTDLEIGTAIREGCQPLSLGEQTLRCETAAVLACGIIQFLRPS